MQRPTESTTLNNQPMEDRGAHWHVQLLAIIIDTFLIGLFFHLLDPSWVKSIDDGMYLAAYWLFFLLYFSLPIYWWGGTPAQLFLRLRVIDSHTLKTPSFWKIFLREILFLTIFTGIGFLIFIFSGFYWDRGSSTKVIILMESKNTKRKTVTYIVVSAIILLAGLFWWFQLRPFFDRKGCQGYAANKAGRETGNYYDDLYKGCLRGKGY